MVRGKDSPFWKYVDQLPGGSWRCKYCNLHRKGRPNRIIAHLAKVEGRGIVRCSGVVPDDVKAEAMKALNKEAPDMQQQQIEETARHDDQGIGSENNPNVHPSSDNNHLQDFQPAYESVSGEASHLVFPEGSLIPFENNELNPAMLHAQFQQPDPLPNSSFPQQNEVNTIISTAQDIHWQNMNGLDFQPANQYVSGEASDPSTVEDLINSWVNCEPSPAMLDAHSQQPDPLPSSSFPQHNEVNTTISTPQYLHRQNMNGLDEAPDTQQQQIEETAHQGDQGIGSENNRNVHPSSDNNLLQDFQPGDQYVSGEASHLVFPDGSLIPFGNNELDPGMWHAQSQQPDPQDLHGQNMNGLGVDIHPVSVRNEFDQSLHTLKRKLEDLSNRKGEKVKELHQLSKKVKTIENGYKRMKEAQSKGNCPTLKQLDEVKKLIKQTEELGTLHVSEKETSRTAPSPQAIPLSTSKLIGREFEALEIRDSLVSDDILRIGVYGMGGVGKTQIMMNIYNELLINGAFDNVFWVTMPKNFDVYELQSVIGNAVHLEQLSNEKDEKIRAALLYEFFRSGKKYVIILDGLWRLFDYDAAGIPLKCNDLKLVITCQSLCVSRGMFCQKEIKISPLDEIWPFRKKCPIEEAWDGGLFMHELGEETELPIELEEIAGDIVESCEGLPLYIKAAATRMRGVTAVQEWSDMLEKMKDPKERFHTLKSQVFDQLKPSYEFLNNHELQRCLIFCAFYCGIRGYPELEAMEKFLVDVGVIDQRNSHEKLLHRARNNLEELEKACLLSIELGIIEMHVSIIDMALHVAADTNLFMVDYGIGSLHEEFQIEGSDELWLMRDARDEISKLSSNGIRLPILMSKEDFSLRMIPDSLSIVFSDMKFLDISESKIEELPNFVSDLVKLTALVLRDCRQLRHIPNIGKLTSLRQLNLFKCSELKDLPDGLEDLVNLEDLNLRSTGIVEIPKGVLRNLRKLQYLYANFVESEELKGLVMLKRLCCMFSTPRELAKFDNSFLEKGHANTEYAIDVTSEKQRLEKLTTHDREDYERTVAVFDCEDEEREDIVLPRNIQELRIIENGSQRITWSDFSGLENLEKLRIIGCNNLEYVMEPEENTRYWFSKLEQIHIHCCNGLEEIIISASSLLHPNPFSCINLLNVCSCEKMKRLLNHDMLLHLPKLQLINVLKCKNMDELISTSNGCTGDFCATTPLPKLQLRTLLLECLPELRSIGAIELAWPIETIEVLECPKLKKIPLQMEQLANGRLTAPSSLREIRIGKHEMEWWNSLEWESLEAKHALEPYLLPLYT